MKPRTAATPKRPATIVSSVLGVVLILGLCDVHGPRWSYSTLTHATPAACAGPIDGSHLHAVGAALTPEHDPGRLQKKQQRWIEPICRPELDAPRTIGRLRPSATPMPAPWTGADHLTARAPPKS